MERSLYRLIVHTFVFDDAGRLLLLRRANTGFLDGHYGLPGGHCDDDEEVLEAARREVLEEAGLHVTELEPCLAMPFRGGVDFIFEAKRWSGRAIIGEPDKCDDLVWAPVDDLPSPTAAFVSRPDRT